MQNLLSLIIVVVNLEEKPLLMGTSSISEIKEDGLVHDLPAAVTLLVSLAVFYSPEKGHNKYKS
ncbi:MAG: hypothetical protein PHW65_05860 [Dehalococcoidales bacterium]|nr:hypothetical protein [Dehalococcoidales bacterium]